MLDFVYTLPRDAKLQEIFNEGAVIYVGYIGSKLKVRVLKIDKLMLSSHYAALIKPVHLHPPPHHSVCLRACAGRAPCMLRVTCCP